MVLKILSGKANYTLNLERGVTLLCGDSATGKSMLTDIILQYMKSKKGSGVKIECAMPVVTVPYIPNNKVYFESVAGSLVVLDENTMLDDPLTLQREAVDNGCWLLYITRKDKGSFLSTSVNSVLRVLRTGKMVTAEPMFKFDMPHRFDWGLVTEDSSSGNDFINNVAYAESLDGKDKLAERGNSLYYHTYFMDGAALSGPMRIYYNEYRAGRLDFILPECFEKILLQSSIFDSNKYVQDVLRDPDGNGANGSGMFTWETFYEKVIGEELPAMTGDFYSKSVLSDCFIKHCCAKHKECPSLTDVKDKVRDTLSRSGFEFLYNYSSFRNVYGYKFDFSKMRELVPDHYKSNLEEFIRDNFDLWKQYGTKI